MSDEKTLQSFDSIKTVISEVDDSDHAVSIKEIELNVQDLQSKELCVNVYQNTDLRKNSNSNTVLSVSSDQGRLFDIFFKDPFLTPYSLLLCGCFNIENQTIEP